MNLDEMLKKRILEKRKTSPGEISNLITMAERRLSEAFNETISNETRLVQAYQVIFTSAAIALRASGYRAKSSDGKHFHTINTLKSTLKKKQQDIRYYQNLRKKRHEDVYEGLLMVSKIEMKRAIETAKKLFEEVKSWLGRNYPDLHTE